MVTMTIVEEEGGGGRRERVKGKGGRGWREKVKGWVEEEEGRERENGRKSIVSLFSLH